MFEFEENHKSFWEQPDKHALVKHHNPQINHYTILTLEPRLFTLIVDDDEYAEKLAKKMIEHGVKVFDNMKVFLEWYAVRMKQI